MTLSVAHASSTATAVTTHASGLATAIPDILLTTVVWTAVATVIAAAISGYLLRELKISEFRQAWVNDLRADIAIFMGAAQRWSEKYEELNDLGYFGLRKAERVRRELQPINAEAQTILTRIRLRFNPRENIHKQADDDFLQSLEDLLNPGRWAAASGGLGWQRQARTATEAGREILKREWEVTKEVRLPWSRRSKSAISP